MNNSVKFFSQGMQGSDEWKEMLKQSSMTEGDAHARAYAYERTFSNDRLSDAMFDTRMYSGMAELPVLGNQYFNATAASMVRSATGFFTIERPMDQPTALFWFDEIRGVTNNRLILPNIGKEDLSGLNSRFSTEAALTVGTTNYMLSTNRKLIPGSVEIHLIHALAPKSPIIIRDDRQGNLLAPAGVLTVNASGNVGVDYRTGVIEFTLGAGFVIAEGDKYSIVGFEDVAGDPAFGQLTGPGNNRVKLTGGYIIVEAEPDMLEAEGNLLAYAARQKAMGYNPNDVITAKLTELYVKKRNGRIVEGLQAGWQGVEYAIDLTKTSNPWLTYDSYLDKFQGELTELEDTLAKQCVKGTQITGYMVGTKIGTTFKKLTRSGVFVPVTDSNYINDLLGYYNGIPVWRHTDLAANEGFAITKLPDDSLAPLVYGTFMPLTNTPIVGNFNNTTQFANGVYYYDVVKPLVPELEYKFTLSSDF
jgi:hypothetical protein